MKLFFYTVLASMLLSCAGRVQKVDVVVYGASSAGVMAAYTAAKQGKNVLLLEPSKHLGGLSSGGLGQTDIGNKYAITGLSRDFYRKIGAHYGKLEQWTFEPHVAQNIFQEYVEEAGLKVLYEEELVSLTLKDKRIIDITTSTGSVYAAKVFIDATYEGDLMAKAGVSFTLGREPNSMYGETWNGVQLMDKHQFMDGIDPYIEEGNPESGLLWGISPNSLAERGSGDTLVQAYNFRLCLTDSVENSIPITRPLGYDSTQFELLLRYIKKKQPHELNWALMHIQPMPGRKTDINNSGPFSTDYIGANYTYPNASYAERKEIYDRHKLYTQSFLYFLGNDERVPEHLRLEMQKYGYPKDEYAAAGNFTPQLYIREARRMVSDYVMTEKHCIGEEVVPDGIGLAAYTMDSHNCQRLVVNGMVKNEGDVQEGLGGLPPYPISYRSIIPKRSECLNLLVPVCLSASHIAFGSIRMEPVFMVLGQSAGLAATLAEDGNVHEVNVELVQEKLKNDPTSDGRIGAIILDNDEFQMVENEGWDRIENAPGRYGRSILKSVEKNASLYVKYLPERDFEDNFYVYLPAGEHFFEISISSEGKLLVDKSMEITLSQNDWVFVEKLQIDKGKELQIKIKGENNTVLDAFAFINVK